MGKIHLVRVLFSVWMCAVSELYRTTLFLSREVRGLALNSTIATEGFRSFIPLIWAEYWNSVLKQATTASIFFTVVILLRNRFDLACDDAQKRRHYAPLKRW
jgi:hypothetical protein